MILSILIALLISCAVAYLIYKADKKRAVPYPMITAALRALLTFACLLLLIAPKINKTVTETLKPIVLLIQDNSTSVNTALGNDTSKYANQLKKLMQDIKVPYQLQTWNLDGAVNRDSICAYKATSTNIAKAINEATALYDQQNLSAVILASDGWYNEGSNPLYAPVAINGTIYTIALGDTAKTQDIRIHKVYANKSTSLNSLFEIKADILAQGCTGFRGNAQLLDGSGTLIATTPINVNRATYDASISFVIKAEKAGLQEYQIRIPALSTEKNTDNNNSHVYVNVIQEKKKILLLAAAPHPDINAIKAALKGLDQYELVVKMAEEAPVSFAEYSCMILHQLPNSNTNITATNLKGKSVWYIAGSKSLYYELNALQPTVHFSLGLSPHSALSQFNKAFNYFILPAQMPAVSDILPPLSVSASDASAQANAQVLFADPQGKPLWVLSNGSPATAVLCGEGLWHWRLYEYKKFQQHQMVDECIRQTINFLCSDKTNKAFRTEMPKQIWSTAEYIEVNAFLVNPNNESTNQPEATISIKDSAGNMKKFLFERYNNHYRANTGVLAAGNYHYTAQTTLNNKNLSDEGHFAVVSSKIESWESGCNYPLLYALAQQNGGHTFQWHNMNSLFDSLQQNEIIKPLIKEHIETRDIIDWKWLFFFILLLATAEWLLRKYWMAM